MRALLLVLLLASPAFAQVEAPPPSDDCECEDCDDCATNADLADPPLPNPYTHRLVKGFGLTVLGGGDLRARDDLSRYGAELGPAGDPSLFGGMLSLQLFVKATRYLRIGGDFTYTSFDAVNIGPDQSGLIIRQKVGYEFISGGALFEGVWPIGQRIELSLGGVLGGGRLNIASFSSRVQSFNQLGANFAALPQSQSLSLAAPFFEAKPALGLRLNASAHFAIDARIGLDILFVTPNSLSYAQGLPIDNAPPVTELEPFVQVGFTLGDWLF